tara:strand:+ start:75 stop:488 length:414 start_codon:yes stop_codon:yes gene_type:complete
MKEYNSLREKIAAEKTERQERYASFAILWERAREAGHKAAMSCTPEPMGVYDPGSGERWTVAEGPCGFAEVRLSKGNTSFARWAKGNAGFQKHYNGGLYHWISAYNQSMDRKQAFARAACEVLKEDGIACYATSHMD